MTTTTKEASTANKTSSTKKTDKPDDTSKIDNMVNNLKTTRDELKVKSKLFQKEMGSTWDSAEQKWQKVEQKMQKLKKATENGATCSGKIYAGDLNKKCPRNRGLTRKHFLLPNRSHSPKTQ